MYTEATKRASSCEENKSYEQVEDIHLILTHIVVCLFKNNPSLLEK